jgi:hypothetical protein
MRQITCFAAADGKALVPDNGVSLWIVGKIVRGVRQPRRLIVRGVAAPLTLARHARQIVPGDRAH